MYLLSSGVKGLIVALIAFPLVLKCQHLMQQCNAVSKHSDSFFQVNGAHVWIHEKQLICKEKRTLRGAIAAPEEPTSAKRDGDDEKSEKKSASVPQKTWWAQYVLVVDTLVNQFWDYARWWNGHSKADASVRRHQILSRPNSTCHSLTEFSL